MKVREMDIEFCRSYMAELEAKAQSKWQYNEMRPCGVNYNSRSHAWAYDRNHQRFRDYKAESENIIAILGLGANCTVIDIGCGTGAFAIHAAKYYRKVYAVDVSKAMLRRARSKARKAKLNNIEFHHSGFLTYEHEAEPVDAIVSSHVLHHLPDFWKLIGLRRMAQMLKTKGKLYFSDVVFSFDIEHYESCIDEFIKSMTNQLGLQSREGLKTHFRQEYSTCDWTMECLLERTGFRIENADYKDGFFATYLCTKRDQ